MIRNRVINSAELFRALRRIVIEQDVANAFSLKKSRSRVGRLRREIPGGKIHGVETS